MRAHARSSLKDSGGAHKRRERAAAEHRVAPDGGERRALAYVLTRNSRIGDEIVSVLDHAA